MRIVGEFLSKTGQTKADPPTGKREILLAFALDFP
jgi:hypothetical protein